MADQPGDTNPAGAAPQAAEGTQPDGQQQQQPIQINAQYVKDLSFENPNAPQSLMPGQEQPSINVNVDVQARQIGPELYEVTLSIKTEAKRAEKTAFLCELSYGGLFTVKAQEEHRPALVLIECPRLIFPFARAIIADATRDGGFAPLMLAPIDFVDLFRRRAAEARARQAEAGSDAPAATDEPAGTA